jgi:hypothetical protein
MTALAPGFVPLLIDLGQFAALFGLLMGVAVAGLLAWDCLTSTSREMEGDE